MQDKLGTGAAVPEFNEAFVSLFDTTHKLEFKTNAGFSGNTGDGAITVAAPDTSDAAVGPGATFDKNVVSSLGGWPQGDLLFFGDRRMWVGGFPDDPNLIRWSGASPFHKVWPDQQFARLSEDDQSTMTGFAALGEQVVVFKRDSIWIMVSTGIDSNNLTQYDPVQVVRGVGCVAQSSIQKIRGKLVFLAEDGVYAFDGRGVQKLSDRISTTLGKMSPGRWHLAASANWKTRSCYLLSLSDSKGKDNNTTFVWDYKNDAWWIWDGFDARQWIKDESSNDLEKLYFMDSEGRIYSFGKGHHDWGAAISSYITTQRLGDYDIRNKVFRQAQIMTTNRSETVTITVLKDDDDSGNAVTLDCTETDVETPWANWTTTLKTWGKTRRKRLKAGFREECGWYQLKVAHSVKYQPFSMSSLMATEYTTGVR
jgi:hypothetical protein